MLYSGQSARHEGAHHRGCDFFVPFFCEEVTVKINGKVVKLSGPEPLEDVLIRAGYDASGVALEMNGILVKRADMANTVVDDEDVLEVFSFTGGG